MSAFLGSASPTQSWNHFRFAVNDGVATLTFDRPQKLNALTFQVYADLRDLLTELPQRDDVRVLVITGTGRGFSSGGVVTEIIGELLLLGEPITSDRALAIGLANAAVEDNELSMATSEVAGRLARGPALAYAATKMLISKQMDMNLGAALELDTMTQALLMKSADHAEFYTAFREGREPKWSGR